MVVTFGEIMMRLSPPGYKRLSQARQLDICFGGAEANVAVSLCNYGTPARFVTALPDNLLGTACLSELRSFGVDVSKTQTRPGRLGVYYYERGAAQRSAQVIYDRENSVFSHMHASDFDWYDILDGADWFHFTGITPALGGELTKSVLAACKAAKEKGITVSFDLNYREKLWSIEHARAVITELMPYVDVLIANESQAAKIFGYRDLHEDSIGKQIDREECRVLAEKLAERFSLSKAALTMRESVSAEQNNFSALLYDGRETVFSPQYNIQMIDRIGSGDSFAGGLIHALLRGKQSSDAVNFGTAAACLKHSIEGDFNTVSEAEVRTLASGGGSGRIQR